jgi:hypothetical protein
MLATMCGVRWTARFLLLVMVAPAFGPLALARVSQPEAPHCMRRPMSGQSVSGQSGQPAMQCHHRMAMAGMATPESDRSQPPSSSLPASDSSENSVRAVGGCCENHDCCRGVTTSEWARPASSQFSFVSLSIESARTPKDPALRSSDFSGSDSARAPPRS